MAEVCKINVDDIPSDRAGFGSKLRVRDLAFDREATFTIVAGDYIDLEAGHISLDSPIGRGLLGSREGDEVTIQLPAGKRRFRVLELTTLPEQVARASSWRAVLAVLILLACLTCLHHPQPGTLDTLPVCTNQSESPVGGPA